MGGRKLLWGPAVSGSVALGKSKSYGTVGLGTMTAAGNTASGAADLPAGFTTAGIKTDSGVEGTAYGKLYHGNSVSSTSSVAGTLQGPFLNSASGSATHTGTHASGSKVSAVSGSGGLAAAGQVPIAGGSGALTAGQSGSTASTFYGNNVAT